MPALLRRVVDEGPQLGLQLAIATHLRLNLLIQVNATLVYAHGRWSRAMRHAPVAALSIADHLGGLEGALASVLLVHEARVGGVGQRLYISQVYILLVVAA